MNQNNQRLLTSNTSGENGLFWDKMHHRWKVNWYENKLQATKCFPVPYHGKEDESFLREKKRLRKYALWYRDSIYILIENNNGIRPKCDNEHVSKKIKLT